MATGPSDSHPEPLDAAPGVDAVDVPTSLRVRLELAHDLDPVAHAARHARDEVPDEWPYGLHKLAHHGIDVRFRAPRRGRVAERVGRSLRHRTGGVECWDTAAALTSRDGADAVLCWDERTGLPALVREAIVGHRPVATGVVWLTDRDEVSAAMTRLARRWLPRAGLVWALSSAMVPLLVSEWGVPRTRAKYIPFGVDTGFFRPAETEAEPGLVVSAGNDRHRDHALLVGAMGSVRERVPEARVEIATRLPVQLPASLGAVRTGLHEGHVRELYGRAQVVAVATRPNVHGSGMTVMLEAMACGRPVVVPDTPGMAEYVVPGETGLVYPVGDEAALADCLRSLLADPQRAAEMGSAGRRRAVQSYDTEVQARRLAAELVTM